MTLRAEMLGDLGCGDADAAADRMNENGLVRFQSAHDDDKLPGREIVDRESRQLPSADMPAGRSNTCAKGAQIVSA